MKHVPTVFVSSTVEDLREYREAARDAALQAGFYPSMQEYFTASGARPPLPACLEIVDAADLVLVIVAHRYGWIPSDQPSGDTKSVTWLECEQAGAEKEVVPFLVDAEQNWPHDRREEFRLMQAAQEQKLSPALADDVQLALRRLGDFKTWLNERGIRATFRTPDDLGRQVASALHQWRDRHPDFGRAEAPRVDDRTALVAYRRELVKASQYLLLGGIDVESADPTSAAARLELAKIYVSLNTTTQVEAEGEQKKRKGGEPRLEREETRPLGALEAIAKNRHVVILGSPGSGKSTLLNHLVFCLCAHQLEPQLDWLSQLEGWPPDDAALVPIVVSLRDFARTVEGRAPHDASRADLLWNFIEGRLEAQNLRSAAVPIEDALDAGRALVLLDGLDEIPTQQQRVLVRRLKPSPEPVAVLLTRPDGSTGGMRHAEMPIFTRTFDLLAWLLPLTNHFPRAHRHTVTRRLTDAALNLRERLEEANLQPANRLTLLVDADGALARLRLYTWIAQGRAARGGPHG